jgi:hypothetical protein
MQIQTIRILEIAGKKKQDRGLEFQLQLAFGCIAISKRQKKPPKGGTPNFGG